MNPICAILAAIALAGGASAQTPSQAQVEEMNCVYEELVDNDDAFDVADTHVMNVSEAKYVAAAQQALQKAAATCTTQFHWSDQTRSLAVNIGLYGVVIDYAADGLGDAKGVEEGEFQKIADVLNATPQADLIALSNGSWRSDRAVQLRIAQALASIGIPNETDTMRYAFAYMEGKVVTLMVSQQWAKTPRS